MRIRTLVVVAVGVFLGVGCSSSPATDAGPPDGGLVVPPGSCAQPGDMGNANGVGAFCTPSGRECTVFPLAGLCLAAVAPDEGQWFCTRTCTMDSQCGADAVCVGDMRGHGCVPTRCAGPPADAGLDDAGSSDAGAGDAADTGASDDAGSAVDAP